MTGKGKFARLGVTLSYTAVTVAIRVPIFIKRSVEKVLLVDSLRGEYELQEELNVLLLSINKYGSSHTTGLLLRFPINPPFHSS